MITEERLSPEQHDTLPEVAQPAENEALFGHGQAAGSLAAAYRNGRMHHALLIHGPLGIGKATLAFALARHLLAHAKPEEAPAQLEKIDRASSLFRQIASGAHPGVLHLTRPLDRDGKKFKTAITVDEIRRVNKFLSMTSHDGGYRIIIVDPADDMNTSAANALLKNLEEPPERTLFILVSHAPGKLLPTIRSRCQASRLQPLCDGDTLSVLAALGEAVPETEAGRQRILERAEGSPRTALLMTRYGGLELAETLDDLLAGDRLDIDKAYKLAEAVSTREADIQLSILNETMLDRIAAGARDAGLRGETGLSAKLSSLWHETRQTIRQAGIYNLDKKQHVVGLISKLHGRIGGAAKLM